MYGRSIESLRSGLLSYLQTVVNEGDVNHSLGILHDYLADEGDGRSHVVWGHLQRKGEAYKDNPRSFTGLSTGGTELQLNSVDGSIYEIGRSSKGKISGSWWPLANEIFERKIPIIGAKSHHVAQTFISSILTPEQAHAFINDIPISGKEQEQRKQAMHDLVEGEDQ